MFRKLDDNVVSVRSQVLNPTRPRIGFMALNPLPPSESSSPPTRRPTLRDVASLAGVSVSTASKALNEREHVRLSTRERVRAAAQELAFTPNQAARSLTGGLTGTVGLIAGDLDGRFSLPILMGAEDAFGTGQVSVFLCDARGDAIRERYHLDALLRRKVDGIIVVGARTDPRPPLPGRIPVPVIYAYAPSESPDDVSVVPDDEQAGVDAVTHLLSTGRRRIAHISGDAAYTAAQERCLGVERALRDHGLELVGGTTSFGAWSEHWGARCRHDSSSSSTISTASSVGTIRSPAAPLMPFIMPAGTCPSAPP